MARKIRIASSQFDVPKTIETDVTTWGDLKPLLDEAGIRYSGMGANLSPENHLLERDDSMLPEGDVNIFLFPQKVSAGADAGSVIDEDVSALSYNVLRSYASENNIPLSGNPKKAELVFRIVSYNVGKAGAPVSEYSANETANADESLTQALREINSICENLLSSNAPEETISEEDAELMESYRQFVG